ncbi:glycosyl transferase family 9 [Desulfovibrio sp. X2]|uniref:glycosyltransferase family 9 protein n=1 Tax=Desulfovibrio sp. X2 TaxID=941449 RepID=UPI000358EAE2|nr:glycosyltransferase family 9 protein [Desulfovibrio sp. X2]EPR42654.1 glycosyl transferase family 9 [Desulfovibrio sp. X2]
MRVLLLNLTRFGDLIQSQLCISGLASQGHEVHLACLENFRAAAGLLDGLSGVAALPGSRLVAGPGADWRRMLSSFWEWGEEVRRSMAPERVVNITPSLAGRVLARHFAAVGAFGAASGTSPVEQVGLCLDEEGFSLDTSPWAAFLQTASRHRGTSPFNVADIFCRVAGLGAGECPPALRLAGPDAANRARVDALLAELEATVLSGLPETPGKAPGGLVALQLGASEERRRWPLEYFACLGRLLWEKCAALPVLLGGPGEQRLAERYAAQADHPHISLVGRTSLPELAAVLTRARLLVTNDTGTMHLAAGLSTPVLAVFLCTAQPWDTGPYLEGALCLEPDMDCHPCAFGAPCARGEACRKAIGPEGVFAAAAACLAGQGWGDAAPCGSRAFVAGRDAWGYLGLTRLGEHAPDDRQAWLLVQRAFYRQFLDGVDSPDLSGLPPLSGTARAELAAPLAEASGLITLLSSQGTLLLRDPLPAFKTKFLASWQRLTARLQADPRLAPLGWLLATQGEERGDNLADILSLIRRFQAGLAALAGLCASSAD